MAFLVLKLNNLNNVECIGQAKDINNMLADAATAEFRTKNGTLSTWRIETIDDVDDAVLAIVVTANKIERMDFIIIDTKLLDQQKLGYSQTYAGQIIAVKDLQDTHYDIENITISKLVDCACLYRSIFQEDKNENQYLVRYAEGDIRGLLKKANEKGRLDLIRLSKGIKNEVLKLE